MRSIQFIAVFIMLASGLGAWAQDSVPMLTEIPMKWVPTLNPDIVLANGFKPHRGFQGTGYRIEPIHRNHGPIDYVAWHDESWNDLTVLFDRAWSWPREMSEAQNTIDLETKHYAKFLTLDWITYEVLSLDGNRALGSIYITPLACGRYGAHAMYWITTPLRDDLEAAFHAEIKQWLDTAWPWGSTYFPGPEFSDQERGRRYQMMERGFCL